jgi:ABC-type transport system involved in cytochrome c biogenesis permease component
MTATHAAANPAPASAVAANRWSRWSDWLNPILVREVQQAVKGRTFALLVLAVILYSIGLAVGVASDEQPGPNAGPTAFSFGLMALVPLVLFVVPMQAYHSMRLELRAGIIEQLLLSRLRPRRIIAGKLAAAMVQYMLYLSVLAPVLATTYLLRGIDVPMIAVCLLLSLLACVAATALAIAAACQGTVPMLQPLANLGMAFSLGMLTLGLMGGIGGGDLVRELG